MSNPSPTENEERSGEPSPAGALPLYKVADQILPWDGIINEYLNSGDLKDAEKSINEFNAEHQHHILVKKAIFIAMEKQAYERELVSRMLSAFYNTIVSSSKLSQGFHYALDSVEDASIDIGPDAKEMLGKFLARAIIDEILPPKFLRTCDKIAKTKTAKEAIVLAQGYINQSHGSERLSRIWGPGDLRSVKRLKEEARAIFQEYFDSEDKKEAELCLRRLNAPSFHFQVVKQGIRLGLENFQQSSKVMALLKYLVESGLISQLQLVHGFRCCVESLNDTKLDVPSADVLLGKLIAQAKSEGWLPTDFSEGS
jgi:programmed cell death protein 4